MTTDFKTWTHENLARFAEDCYERLREKEQEIEDLKNDLRTVLTAYRQELMNHAGKTD